MAINLAKWVTRALLEGKATGRLTDGYIAISAASYLGRGIITEEQAEEIRMAAPGTVAMSADIDLMLQFVGGCEFEEDMDMPLTGAQQEMAMGLRDAMIGGEREIEELASALRQTIEDARNGLVQLPVPGGEWNEAMNYIAGDTAKEDGALYEAAGYSRGKRPSEHPELWRPFEEAATPNWADIADGTVILEGIVVAHGGKMWACVSQHIKSQVYAPKAGSTKWEEI